MPLRHWVITGLSPYRYYINTSFTRPLSRYQSLSTELISARLLTLISRNILQPSLSEPVQNNTHTPSRTRLSSQRSKTSLRKPRLPPDCLFMLPNRDVMARAHNVLYDQQPRTYSSLSDTILILETSLLLLAIPHDPGTDRALDTSRRWQSQMGQIRQMETLIAEVLSMWLMISNNEDLGGRRSARCVSLQ